MKHQKARDRSQNSSMEETRADNAVNYSAMPPAWRHSPTLDALRSGALFFDFKYGPDEDDKKTNESPEYSSKSVSQANSPGSLPILAKSLLQGSSASPQSSALPPRHSGPKLVPRFPSLRVDDILTDVQDNLAHEYQGGTPSERRTSSCYTNPVSVQLAAMVYQLRELCCELHQDSTTVWFDYRRCLQDEKRILTELRDARSKADNAESSMRQMQETLNMYEDIERVRSQDDDRQQKSIENLRKFIDMERRLRAEAEELHKKATVAWAERDQSQQVVIDELKTKIGTLSAELQQCRLQDQESEAFASQAHLKYQKTARSRLDDDEVTFLRNQTKAQTENFSSGQEKMVGSTALWSNLVRKMHHDIEDRQLQQADYEHQIGVLRKEAESLRSELHEKKQEISGLEKEMRSVLLPKISTSSKDSAVEYCDAEGPETSESTSPCMCLLKDIVRVYRESEKEAKSSAAECAIANDLIREEQQSRHQLNVALQATEALFATQKQQNLILMNTVGDNIERLQNLEKEIIVLKSKHIESEEAHSEIFGTLSGGPIMLGIESLEKLLCACHAACEKLQIELNEIFAFTSAGIEGIEEALSETKRAFDLLDWRRLKQVNIALQEEGEIIGFELDKASDILQELIYTLCMCRRTCMEKRIEESSKLQKILSECCDERSRKIECEARVLNLVCLADQVRLVLQEFNIQEDLHPILASLRDESRKIQESMNDAQSGRDAAAVLRLHIAELEKQVGCLKEEVDNYKTKELRHEQVILELKQVRESLSEEVKREREGLATFHGHILEGEKRLEQADEMMRHFRNELLLYKSQAIETQREQEVTVAKLQAKTKEIILLQSQQSHNEKNILELKDRLNASQSELDRVNLSLFEMSEQCDAHRKDLNRELHASITLRAEISAKTSKIDTLERSLKYSESEIERYKVKTHSVLEIQDLVGHELQKVRDDLVFANEYVKYLKSNMEMDELNGINEIQTIRRLAGLEQSSLRSRLVEEVMAREHSEEELRKLKKYLEKRSREEWEQKEIIENLYYEIRTQQEKIQSLEALSQQLKTELELEQAEYIMASRSIKDFASEELEALRGDVAEEKRCSEISKKELRLALREVYVLKEHNEDLNRQLEDCFDLLDSCQVKAKEAEGIMQRIEVKIRYEREKVLEFQQQIMLSNGEIQRLKRQFADIQREKQRQELDLELVSSRSNAIQEDALHRIKMAETKVAETDSRLNEGLHVLEQAKTRLIALIHKYKRPTTGFFSFENSDSKSAETTFTGDADLDSDRDAVLVRYPEMDAGLDCCSIFSCRSDQHMSIDDCISSFEEVLKSSDSHAFQVEHQLILKSVSERTTAETLRMEVQRLEQLLMMSDSSQKELILKFQALDEMAKRDSRLVSEYTERTHYMNEKLKHCQMQNFHEIEARKQCEQAVQHHQILINSCEEREKQALLLVVASQNEIEHSLDVICNLQNNIDQLRYELDDITESFNGEMACRREVEREIAELNLQVARLKIQQEETDKMFHLQLTTANNKAEFAEKRVEDLNQRLKIEAEHLKRASEEAEALNCILASETSKKESARDSQMSALKIVNEKNSQLQEQHIALQEALVEIQKQSEKAYKYQNDALQLRSKMENDRKEHAAHLHDLMAQAEEDLCALRTQLRSEAGQRELLAVNLKDVLQECETHRELLQQYEERILRISKDCKRLTDKADDSEKTVQLLRKEIEEIQRAREVEITTIRQAAESAIHVLKAQISDEVEQRVRAESALEEKEQSFNRREQEITSMRSEYEALLLEVQELSRRATRSEAALDQLKVHVKLERADFEDRENIQREQHENKINDILAALCNETEQRELLELIVENERRAMEVKNRNMEDLQVKLDRLAAQSSEQVCEYEYRMNKLKERACEAETQKSRLIEELHELRWSYKKEVEAAHAKLSAELVKREHQEGMLREIHFRFMQEVQMKEELQLSASKVTIVLQEHLEQVVKCVEDIHQVRLDILQERAQIAKEKQDIRSRSKHDTESLITRINEELEQKNKFREEIQFLKELVEHKKIIENDLMQEISNYQCLLLAEKDKNRENLKELGNLRHQIETEMLQREQADEFLSAAQHLFDAQRQEVEWYQNQFCTVDLMVLGEGTQKDFTMKKSTHDPNASDDSTVVVSQKCLNEHACCRLFGSFLHRCREASDTFDLSLQKCELASLELERILTIFQNQRFLAETQLIYAMKAVMAELTAESEQQCTRAAVLQGAFLSGTGAPSTGQAEFGASPSQARDTEVIQMLFSAMKCYQEKLSPASTRSNSVIECSIQESMKIAALIDDILHRSMVCIHPLFQKQFLKSKYDVLPMKVNNMEFNQLLDQRLSASDLESERQMHQTKNLLYMKMQEEISNLKDQIYDLETLYHTSKVELSTQKQHFEEQLRNMMHACVAEELVSEEFRRREAKALDRLSESIHQSP